MAHMDAQEKDIVSQCNREGTKRATKGTLKGGAIWLVKYAIWRSVLPSHSGIIASVDERPVMMRMIEHIQETGMALSWHASRSLSSVFASQAQLRRDTLD